GKSEPGSNSRYGALRGRYAMSKPALDHSSSSASSGPAGSVWRTSPGQTYQVRPWYSNGRASGTFFSISPSSAPGMSGVMTVESEGTGGGDSPRATAWARISEPSMAAAYPFSTRDSGVSSYRAMPDRPSAW